MSNNGNAIRLGFTGDVEILLVPEDRHTIGQAFPPAIMKTRCMKLSPASGVKCTRRKGHSGLHVAHVNDTEARAIWAPWRSLV